MASPAVQMFHMKQANEVSEKVKQSIARLEKSVKSLRACKPKK